MSPNTILVVEDNAATRKLVSFALARRGHRVLESADGRGALELMEHEQPALVLQDIILPDVDGFELVAELRKRARGPVVILAFSGFSSTSDEARMSAVGFDDVITKPIEPSRLIPLIEAHLLAIPSDADRFGMGRRLVVVDDDLPQLKLTAIRLEQLGFAVEVAGDGNEAIALIQAQPPDAVVSDVLMPNLDGFGLAMAVRQDPRLAATPVLLVTSSYVDQADQDFARRAGANGLVLRTPEQRELIQALRGLMKHPPAASALSPSILPGLEEERTKRVMRQLEKHVVINAGLARRCSALAAELAVLVGISDAMLKHQNIEIALDVALASFFDAGGISMGGLYLLDGDGSFRTRPLGTKVTWQPGELESFFGHPELLRRMIASKVTTFIPVPPSGGKNAYPADAVQKVLERCGGSAAMVVPLVHLDQPRGALFMVARGQELEQEDWLVFAQGVGSQIAHSLALADAFAERESARRRAQESRADWQALAENAPDTIIRLDGDGVIQFVNRTTPPREREDLLGRPWLENVPSEYHHDLSQALRMALTTGVASSHEIMVPGPNGKTEWFSSRIGPVVAGVEITGAIVISRNITEKKQEEARLIVADRMASVGTLAAGVAHEINNPLAAVIANLELAHRDALELAERSGRRELVDYLQDAQEAAERVRLIVRDLKVFSRAEEDHMGPTDVRAVLESTLRMAWNEIRHRARLVKEFARLPPVDANESRLGQVFLNLLINATHAIPEGQTQRHEIRVVTRMDESGMVAIDIIDSGVGMSEDVQRRLFTPFFTTKSVGVGTGLGLSICQRLIGAMGGAIRVTSVLGQGSTFTVLLPPASLSVPSASAASNRAGSPASRRGRLLVVDDEEVVAMAIRRSLTSEHDVVYASTAHEALSRLHSGEEFDVILCDLMMPEMSGMDFYADVLRSAPEQARRVIFVTGGAFTAQARAFLDAVPNLRIEKPFNVQQLRALVNERLR